MNQNILFDLFVKIKNLHLVVVVRVVERRVIVVKTYWKEKSLNSKIKIIICLAD